MEEELVVGIVKEIALTKLLWFIVIPGFVGGIISALFDFLNIIGPINSNSGVDCKRCALFTAGQENFFQQLEIFFYRAIIGIGGAFGVIFVGLWVGKVTIENSIQNQILLISLCMVAGIVSYKILPVIGTKLEEHLLEKKISESNQKSSSAVEKSLGAINYAEALQFARTALSKKDNNSPDILLAIQRLEKIEPSFPTNRPLHMFLGRLYRKLTQYDKGIEVLRKYIENKKAAASSEDENQNKNDIADALYNISCYHILKAEGQVAHIHPDERERLISEAISELTNSIELNSYNRAEASKDDDFKHIKKDARFKKIFEV